MIFSPVWLNLVVGCYEPVYEPVSELRELGKVCLEYVQSLG